MSTGPTYYCWYCYATGPSPDGPCEHCGEPIEGPPGLDYVDRLLWTLRHPLPERRIIATEVLGARKEHRALAPLRALLTEKLDPYLATAVLTALVRIGGVRAHRELLDAFATRGPAPAKRVALSLLGRPLPD